MESNKISRIAINNLVESPYQGKDAQVFSIAGNLLHRNLRTIEMAIALRP